MKTFPVTVYLADLCGHLVVGTGYPRCWNCLDAPDIAAIDIRYALIRLIEAEAITRVGSPCGEIPTPPPG